MSSPHRNIPGGDRLVGFVRLGKDLADRYPTDLALVTVAVVIGALAAVLLASSSPIRFLVALPLVVFLPGYAATAFLFPSSGADAGASWRPRDRGIDGVERAGIAFGTSLAIVPLLVVAVGSVLPLTPVTVLGTLSVFTLGVTQLAAVRRLQLPPEHRTRIRPRRAIGGVLDRSFGGRSTLGKLAAVVLVSGLVVGTGSVAMAVAHPPAANSFTQFFVTTENEDGELVASNYPSTMVEGESAPLVVGVENHERATQQYTVVVQLQRVEGETVAERAELGRFADSVPAGETWLIDHEVTPEITGDDLRLTYLLYRGEPPEAPTRENADHELHIWIDVEEA